MRTLEVDTIKPGTITEDDYYSDKGALLIAGGTAVTQRHIEYLQKRNIFQVYIKNSRDDDIEYLLSRELSAIEDLELDTVEIALSSKPFDIGEIKSGRDGFKQLQASPKARELDVCIKKGLTCDRPVGPPLEQSATQLAAGERTREYKIKIRSSYDSALDETTAVLNLLAQGKQVDGKQVRDIVERFVAIFVTDKNILLNLSAVNDYADDYIYNHSLNVCLLAINIAASCGYSRSQVVEIGMGALLHDVGMMLIPAYIRTKKGRLIQEEWFEVQKHPILGLHLLEKLSRMPASVPYIAYQCHERENSVGYPKKRNTRLIHRFAKVVQVADIYEALTSKRCYRKELIPYEGMRQMIKMTRAGLVADEYVKAFLRYASLFPVGSMVQLNDGRIARVIQSNPESYAKPVVSVLADYTYAKPVVRVLTDYRGQLMALNDVEQIDLHLNKEIQIVKALPNDFMKNVGLMDGF